MKSGRDSQIYVEVHLDLGPWKSKTFFFHKGHKTYCRLGPKYVK